MANTIPVTSDTVVKLLVRRGVDSDRKNVILSSGELGYTTDTSRLFIGNGRAYGGNIVGNLGLVTTTGKESFANPYPGDFVYEVQDITGNKTGVFYVRSSSNVWVNAHPTYGAPFMYTGGQLLFNDEYLTLDTDNHVLNVYGGVSSYTLSGYSATIYNLPIFNTDGTNKLYVDTLVSNTSNSDRQYTRDFLSLNFVPLSGKATMFGTLSSTVNIAVPTLPVHDNDLTNKLYVDTSIYNQSVSDLSRVDGKYLPLSGGTLVGFINSNINSTHSAITLTQYGTGPALVVTDTNYNLTPLTIDNFGSIGIGMVPIPGGSTKINIVGGLSATGNIYSGSTGYFANNVGIGISTPTTTLDIRGNVNIGDPNLSTTATSGNKLFFNGANNTDELSIYRYNTTANQSELRVNIGDDTVGSYGDYFAVGNIPTGTTAWVDWLRLSSNTVTFPGSGQFSGNTFIGSGVTQGFYGDGTSIALRAYNNAASDIYFQTFNGATTNMIVKNDGRVGIGKLNPSSNTKLDVTGNTRITGTLSATSTIYSDGDIIAYASSDARLKNNIVPITSALEKLITINGVEYDWNADLQNTHTGHDVGVIAQEIEQILPEAVITRDDGYKAVRYEKLIPLLIQAIKELSNKVELK